MLFLKLRVVIVVLLVAAMDWTLAFVPAPSTKSAAIHSFSNVVSKIARPSVLDDSGYDIDTRSFLLSNEDIKPLITLGKGENEKIINAFGLWCMLVSILTGPLWMLAMKLVHRMENDENREMFDMTGKLWAKSWLTLTNCYPTVSGNLERMQKNNNLGACLYVANHASWLDIPVLCTVIDPVFKFIAKGELSQVPCIGTQLIGGEHILINRDDRKSQLRTFKETINWLQKKVPIMAFPEGQRSMDGHLMNFKGGLFLAAVKTNVPIVPITLHHTHAVMPGNSYFPVQSGAGKLHVHIHDAIETNGKTEKELAALVRAAFLKTLPLEQHPLEEVIPSATEEEELMSVTKPDMALEKETAVTV